MSRELDAMQAELERIAERVHQEQQMEAALAPIAVTFCHTGCGRAAVMPGPSGEAFCEICAKREARLILKQRRHDLEVARRTNPPLMAIPRKRRSR